MTKPATTDFDATQPDSSAKPAETPTEPQPRLRFEFSPTIGKLFGALAKARKAFKPVLKTSKNPFFKSNYADLAEVLSATTDALSDNGIAVVQAPTEGDFNGKVEIITFMAHDSGEWIRSTLPMPVSKGDAQGVGSSITYGRRYAYSAMVNVASEFDDDGNAASGKTADDEKYAAEFDQRTEGQRRVTDYQIRAWTTQIGKVRTESQVKAYLAKLGLKSIEEMQRQDFDAAIKWLLNPDKGDLTATVKASVDQAQFRKLFAVAKEKQVPEADLKQYAYEKYNVDSLTKLTSGQIKEVQDWLGSLA